MGTERKSLDEERSSTKPPASGPVPVAIEDGDRLRVLEHIEGGVAVVQSDGFLYANETLLRMLGFGNLEAMVANKVSAITSEPYETWAATHDSGRPRIESWRCIDGTILRVDVTVSTMKVGEAHVRVALVRDVSADERAQVQLQQTERLAAVGSLAAGVAHQLNNPLAYVLANINFLAEDMPAFLREVAPQMSQPQNERLAELLGAMADAREGAERVARIVRDLRTFSRMEDERRERVDVHTLLDSACSVVESELKSRGRLVKVFDVVSPVEANPSRLAQVFLNLLLNAAHAIREGAVSRNEICVRTYTDDREMVVVEISDTGVGMSPGVQARIFDPFYTLKPPGEGTGLGLTTALAIVHAVGGTITVESTEGRGATFRVKLPAAVKSATREVVASSPPEGELKTRMLIVDDELTLLASLRRALGREIDVVLASSAKEALAILEQDDRFDVVLCDIMMPDVTGIELFERVSSEFPALRDRFVFMTGGAFGATMQQFIDKTQLPRLEKPFDVRDLRRLIRRRAAPRGAP
jgi:signal transduction histidine kinase/ActR/RegA family two-component response regulator